MAEQASGAVAGVVLAAGSSMRFGSRKLDVSVAGTAMWIRVVNALLDAGLSPVVVVTSTQATEVTSWPASDPVEVVVNPRAAEGIGTSLAAGISACPATAPAAVIAVADQPGLTPELVSQLVAAWRDGLGSIVRPTWRGAPRHPVLFDGALFSELAKVDAHRGGASVIARHTDDLHTIAVEDALLVADVDTTDDLTRFVSH